MQRGMRYGSGDDSLRTCVFLSFGRRGWDRSLVGDPPRGAIGARLTATGLIRSSDRAAELLIPDVYQHCRMSRRWSFLAT